MNFEKFSKLPDKLFGLLFWNIFAFYGVAFVCLGVLALFGVKPVEFNGEPVYGVWGFVLSIVMAPFIALVMAFAIWLLLIVGNFLLRLFIRARRN